MEWAATVTGRSWPNASADHRKKHYGRMRRRTLRICRSKYFTRTGHPPSPYGRTGFGLRADNAHRGQVYGPADDVPSDAVGCCTTLMADEECCELLLEGEPTGTVEVPVEWMRDGRPLDIDREASHIQPIS